MRLANVNGRPCCIRTAPGALCDASHWTVVSNSWSKNVRSGAEKRAALIFQKAYSDNSKVCQRQIFSEKSNPFSINTLPIQALVFETNKEKDKTEPQSNLPQESRNVIFIMGMNLFREEQPFFN